MYYDEMNAIQRKLHEAAFAMRAQGDKNGFERLQLDAIDEIQRLREWIAQQGENTDTCTRDVLGVTCENCRCGRVALRPNTTNDRL